MPKTPALTVDCVIFGSAGQILLVRRKFPPFQGAFALPGGFVEIGETVEQACRREVFEETCVVLSDLALVGVYSEPSRDPRGHTCSVAFMSTVTDVIPVAGDDAEAAEWIANWRGVDLAFDHQQIIADALQKLDAFH